MSRTFKVFKPLLSSARMRFIPIMIEVVSRKSTIRDIAGRIRVRLSELGVSARAASLNTNRGPEVIRGILRAAEQGKDYHPRIDTLTAIAKSLKVNPYWLQFGDLYEKNNLDFNSHDIETSFNKDSKIYNTDTPEFAGILENGVYRERKKIYDQGSIKELRTHPPIGVDPRFTQLHQLFWIARGDGGREAGITDGMFVTGVPRVEYVRLIGPLRWGMLVVLEQTKDEGRLVEASIRRLDTFPGIKTAKLDSQSCWPGEEPLTISLEDASEDGLPSIIAVITSAHLPFLLELTKPHFQ